MVEILVLAEHVDDEIKKVTLELITLARRFGEPAVVWTGAGAEQAQARCAEYGAARMYVAADAAFDDYVVAPAAELLAQLVREKSPALVLLAGTAQGKEVAGRLAVKIDSGVLTDAVDLQPGDDGPVAEQSNFGGSTIVHARVRRGTVSVSIGPAVLPGFNPEVAVVCRATSPSKSTPSMASVDAHSSSVVGLLTDSTNRPGLKRSSRKSSPRSCSIGYLCFSHQSGSARYSAKSQRMFSIVSPSPIEMPRGMSRVTRSLPPWLRNV